MNTSTKTTAPEFIVYVRVSTTEQGRSGLGIEAQQHACRQFIEQQGGTMRKEFIEVDSGANDDRPKLLEALRLARTRRATLVVAKLDRLSREVSLIAQLMKNTKLVCVDASTASTLELHMRAAFAQEERLKISVRTKDALAAVKRRGTKLGSSRPDHWKGREDRRELGARRGAEQAARNRRIASANVYNIAAEFIENNQLAGQSLRKIAAALNTAEISTPSGGNWHAAQVARVLV